MIIQYISSFHTWTLSMRWTRRIEENDLLSLDGSLHLLEATISHQSRLFLFSSHTFWMNFRFIPRLLTSPNPKRMNRDNCKSEKLMPLLLHFLIHQMILSESIIQWSDIFRPFQDNKRCSSETWIIHESQPPQRDEWSHHRSPSSIAQQSRRRYRILPRIYRTYLYHFHSIDRLIRRESEVNVV